MKKWVLLAGAIIAEVSGTIMLRAAVDHPVWVVPVAVAYAAAFTLVGLTLRAGLPIGVAYGIWGAVGVALVALLGTTIFAETISAGALIGIAIIIVGVILVETGSHPRRTDDDEALT
ncbi:SMR family transporter [Microbacterium sp. H1-D42]|uniref:DMT family transporter n=1 Tax=Microbacterium sp. H1-D42 TaxID=2925844 RepID=UPI001F52BA45|nr:SMR family transporter [Microbacterium sp. H1-D42]UNK69506.1 SMR family transporter [Microbacterium sp. H1-D42]